MTEVFRYTFSMIKPDATRRNKIGEIISCIESEGFKIVAQKMLILTEEKVSKFYHVHRERSFFPEMVKLVASGPVVVQVLHRDDAVQKYRELMGATNPEISGEETIRRKFGLSISENSVHGSDSEENAKKEISFFFPEYEIFA